MAPVAAAGPVVGSAAYGVKKAVEEQDPSIVGAAVIGAGAGAGTETRLGSVAGAAVGAVPSACIFKGCI